MGIRFLVLVVAFLSVSFQSIYANTVSTKVETINKILNKVNLKVRRSKTCEETNEYLEILDNLHGEEFLTIEHQERIDTIYRNQC